MKAITPTREEFEFFRFSEELADWRAKKAEIARAERERKLAVLAALRQKTIAMMARETRGAYPDESPRWTRTPTIG